MLKFARESRSRVVYDSQIAEALGVNAAIILSRIIWSISGHIEKNKTEFEKNGRWWMYDTRAELANYSRLTDKQIKSVLTLLREKKIIETGQFDKQFAVRRNWFTVNMSALLEAIGTKGTNSEIDPLSVQKGPIDRYKRDQCIGTKGTNTSLSKNLSKNLTKRGSTRAREDIPPPIENLGFGDFLPPRYSSDRNFDWNLFEIQAPDFDWQRFNAKYPDYYNLDDPKPHEEIPPEDKNAPPFDSKEQAASWLDKIKKIQPGTKCDVPMLSGVIDESMHVLETVGVSSFASLLEFVEDHGNSYEHSVFFGRPPEMLKRDQYGAMMLGEVCVKYMKKGKAGKLLRLFKG